MTTVASAVLFRSESKRSGFHANERLKGFLYQEKGRETLIIHRNQDLLDTPKMCFGIFRPMNVVNF